MTTSPTFTSLSYGSYTAPTYSVNGGDASSTSSITYSGSSLAVGGAVTINENGSTLAGVYQGYYNNGGVEDPLIYITSYGIYTLLGQNNTASYTITSAAYTACYHNGTRIKTEHGETSVESLQIGDVVVTASGAHRAIKWIGRRSYHGRFLVANPCVLPILIEAGALGDSVPTRDLRVSPQHAMFIDGVLVEAKELVNGRTIRQVLSAERVDYVHIELETHDIILAEGAASETFIDDDSRMVFHNAADFFERYPETTPQPALYCAPRVNSGPVLEAIRTRLAGFDDLRLAA